MKFTKIFALILVAFSLTAFSQAGVRVLIAPPPIVIATPPPIPADGYLWTPGYYVYDINSSHSYRWISGQWVLPPYPGALWTPGYWGYNNSGYWYWNDGYWGPRVGYYGGINYGFGYFGVGFYGGYWSHGHFYYNRSLGIDTHRAYHHYAGGYGGHGGPVAHPGGGYHGHSGGDHHR